MLGRGKGKPSGGKFAKLVALLKEHPGQTAIQLQHLGWRPEMDGELEEAQKAGLIVWVHGKWYAVSAPPGFHRTGPKGKEG